MASLFVEYESSLLPHLPFPLHTSDQCLVFALQPRSKSHRDFFSKVVMELMEQLSESVPEVPRDFQLLNKVFCFRLCQCGNMLSRD